MKNNSLTQRIIVTIVILLTLTCTIFGAGLFLLKQKLEEATFGKMVKEQLHEVLVQPESEKLLANPLFKGWSFYKNAASADLPEKIRRLTPGTYHSVEVEDRYLHVEVENHQGQQVYMVYDVTDWEEQEHALLQALALGIVVVLLGGVAMGAQAAKTILIPVKRLSNRVANIQPGQRNIRIADEFNCSEIGQIAEAVDGYLERLDQFVAREQSFSAAASHELRTPLSVIMGAVDILDTNPDLPATTRAVDRIKRACRDMHAFIEATLFLSREGANSISQQQSADIAKIIGELIDDNSIWLEQSQITLTQQIESSPIIQQPKSIVQITIGNILRNAIEHSAGKSISIALRDNTLQISDTGEGIAEESLPYIFDASYTTKPGGTGLGLNLVKRVCDRFGWQLDVESKINTGTTVEIIFSRAC